LNLACGAGSSGSGLEPESIDTLCEYSYVLLTPGLFCVAEKEDKYIQLDLKFLIESIFY
jgi:hypothetical protein